MFVRNPLVHAQQNIKDWLLNFLADERLNNKEPLISYGIWLHILIDDSAGMVPMSRVTLFGPSWIALSLLLATVVAMVSLESTIA